MKSMRQVIGFVAGFLAIAGSASAAVTVYGDRASFAAGVTGYVIAVEDFDSFAAGSIVPVSNGVSFAASQGSPVITDQFLSTTGANSLASTSFGFFGPQETATFTFSTPVTAFAIDVNTSDVVQGAYSATLNLGDVILSGFDPFPGQLTGQFIGFVSDVAFTTVTIASINGFSFNLDTLMSGNLKPVTPEIPLPGALPLLLTGLGLLGAARRRRPQPVSVQFGG